MKRLILASNSPARKEILSQANIKFDVVASNYVEDMSLELGPGELAKYLSEGKARAVAKRESNSLVIGADSFVVFEGKLLGKPRSKKKAIEMLRMLSGKSHQLITGFTVIDSDTGASFSDFVVSLVFFKKLSRGDIENYIESENVLEKAGAYAIQGLGGRLIEKIEGDRDSIIGLPLDRVLAALRDFGYDPDAEENQVKPIKHKNPSSISNTNT